MRAIKLNTDNTVEVLDMDTVNGSALEPLQASVGGYIEAIGLTEGVDMIIDEEGKFKRPLLPNALAMTLLTYLDRPLFDGDFIAGTAVIVGRDDEGDTVDCPDSILTALTDLGIAIPETV